MREISSYTRTDESNVTTASPNSPGHAALGSGPVGRDERSNRFFHKTGSEPPLRWFNFQPMKYSVHSMVTKQAYLEGSVMR